MSFTSKPIRNIVVPSVALLLGIWLRPILLRLPTPQLPQIELSSLNGTSRSADSCRVIQDPAAGLKFCEDVVHWQEAELAIVSCDAGRLEWNTVMGPLKNPAPHGALYAYHLRRPSSATVKQSQPGFYQLELGGFPSSKDFHPLGLEIYSSDERSASLFVINHRRDRSVIEVFGLEIDSKKPWNAGGQRALLKWRRTLAHEQIWTPNSMVALGPNLLLVTNDHYINRRAHPFLHVLETWLALPGGNVIEVSFDDDCQRPLSESWSSVGKDERDGQEWDRVQVRKVVERICFANGVALSPDGLTLVVASSATNSLYYYHRKPPTGPEDAHRFAFAGSRALNFAPDNVSFNGPRQVLVAGHPHGLTLLKFTRDPQNARPAGSWVVVVSDFSQVGSLDPSRASVVDVFRDDGNYFGSSSTAFVVSLADKKGKQDAREANQPSRLVVSGLYQTGLLECEI